ncbi:MAG TPA: prepilin-type N-terminal cleavage/methylation domain-containing protein [Gemmatimonadales bacterium]|nr:prepilin-type N-terminal cleavage/methylation domain-containing protein [Gemmatimonadales bacterium]
MKRTEAGFSLVELLLAVTLLAVLLVGVARLNFVLAQRFYKLSQSPARDGAIAQAVNQFAAVPFDSLNAKAGSVTFSKPPFPYTRTVIVDSLTPTWRRVTIIITPQNSVYKSDTIRLQRTKPAPNPFST